MKFFSEYRSRESTIDGLGRPRASTSTSNEVFHAESPGPRTSADNTRSRSNTGNSLLDSQPQSAEGGSGSQTRFPVVSVSQLSTMEVLFNSFVRMGIINCVVCLQGQFPVSGIFRACGISDKKGLLRSNCLLNFRATFSLTNNRISARSENSSDWKSALRASEDVSLWCKY